MLQGLTTLLHLRCLEIMQKPMKCSILSEVNLGTPAIEPVPVSERRPGPEDCDADGFCWFWDYGWTRQQRGWHDDECTHWLPHWALPVPAPANNTGGTH
jgi:hypothetical protein